jgi:beta-mannosidase
VVAVAKRELVVPARGALELNAVELLDGFHDLSYAYRFGPAAYDVAVATFVGVNAAPVFAAHFPTGRAPREVSDIGLSASAQAGDGGYVLTVKARAFARWVTVQADGFVCEDQYFHLPPGTERVLSLRPAVAGAPRALRGIVSALNSSAAAAIEMRA